MKRKLLLPVLALTAFLGTLLSCSSDSGTASIQIPVTQIFRNVEKDILPSDTNKIKLEITLSGDAKGSLKFNWEEREQNCTFENLPVGGVVSVSAKVKDGNDLIYSGESDKIKLKNEQNETTITMQKLMARLTVKTDNKEIAGLSDKTEITINAAAEGFSRSWTITPREFAAGYEIKDLPPTGKVTITANVKDGENLLFSGSHEAENIKENQGALTIQMTKLLARLTVKTDNKEIAGLTDTTEIIIKAAAEGFSRSWTITPIEFAAGYEIKDLPPTGKVTITANVKDGENLLFSGSHEAENIKENQGALTIQMTKLLARLTVKTDNKEIAGLTDTTEIIIDAAAEGFPKSLTITPKEFAAGYELKYLPINKELTVTAEAKTKDTTDTAIFRGSSKITITEKDQKPECTIEMKKVNGDASVEIRTLPTPELKAISANGNTFSLTQDTEPPVALFTISYIDSSNPDINLPLPDWVTYKWKMNGTEFTPDDASGQATFGKNKEGELILTIYLKKMKSLLLQGSDVGSTQNNLYVEIGMENSDETKSTEIEFTITQ